MWGGAVVWGVRCGVWGGGVVRREAWRGLVRCVVRGVERGAAGGCSRPACAVVCAWCVMLGGLCGVKARGACGGMRGLLRCAGWVGAPWCGGGVCV